MNYPVLPACERLGRYRMRRHGNAPIVEGWKFVFFLMLCDSSQDGFFLIDIDTNWRKGKLIPTRPRLSW